MTTVYDLEYSPDKCVHGWRALRLRYVSLGWITPVFYYCVFACVFRVFFFFFFQAEDGIRDFHVTGVQTCALPIFLARLLDAGLLHEKEMTVTGRTIGDEARAARETPGQKVVHALNDPIKPEGGLVRSEERRVGKEWRSGGAPKQ